MSERIDERVAFVYDLLGDKPIPGKTYDVGPAAEDGKVWVWERPDTVLAGPFEEKEAALRWLRSLGVHPSVTRTPAFSA